MTKEPVVVVGSGAGASPAGTGATPALEPLLDVSMSLCVEIGRTVLTVQDVLHLSPGSVVSLQRMVGEPVDVYVSDRKFAQGEVVVVGEHFGVRLTRILSAPQTEATA